jgi:hypothetical protein
LVDVEAGEAGHLGPVGDQFGHAGTSVTLTLPVADRPACRRYSLAAA